MESRTVYIPSMACGGCAAAIRRAVEALDGVASARATPADKLLTVEWAAPADWPGIVAALEEVGHPPGGSQG